jgi:cyclophilin family peptidyl-prolyl cis-trans isomerase
LARRHRLPLIAVLAAAAAAGGCGASSHPAPTTARTLGPVACAAAPAPHLGARHVAKPTAALAPAKTYDVAFATNCGTFVVRLDQRVSPHVAAAFAGLVRDRYFDRTIFHRIVPGFVIQGGDPTGTGTGGPGWTVRDAPPATTRYLPGVVAMAKAQDDPPGTAGSQFFVVTGSDASSLGPDYAVVGRVVSGMPVVRRIGRLGDPATEQPTTRIEIEHATLATR